MQQLAVNSASLSVLNRHALNWKPREGIEIDTSYQIQQNLTSALATEGSEIAAISGKMKVDPKTTVGLGYSYAQTTNFADVKTEVGSIRLTSEYALAERPVTLQLNPGYETTFGAADSQSIRAFVETAVIWKVDNITTLTFGSGFAGGAYTAQSGYILVQHLISPGTSMAMRAEFLNAENDQPGEGFALSAGPTIALAQALSAGLNVRYKMDENAPVERPKNETTLSLSISGRF